MTEGLEQPKPEYANPCREYEILRSERYNVHTENMTYTESPLRGDM